MHGAGRHAYAAGIDGISAGRQSRSAGDLPKFDGDRTCVDSHGVACDSAGKRDVGKVVRCTGRGRGDCERKSVRICCWPLPFDPRKAAEIGTLPPFIFITVAALDPLVVTSPLKSQFVICVAEEKQLIFAAVGVPVVVTPVPGPPIGVLIPKVRSSVIEVITPPDVTTVAIAITPEV